MNRGLFLLSFYSLSILVQISTKDCHLKPFVEGKDRYLSGFVQTTVDNVGFHQCMKMCYRKVNCDSINYDQRGLSCEMNTAISTGQVMDTILDIRQGWLHTVVNKTTMEGGQAACDVLNCPRNTQCVTLRNDTSICHPEPCRRADYMLSAQGRFCFKIHDQLLSYQAAKDTCSNENASLTIVNSEAKMDYFDKQHLRFKYPTRIGFLIAGEYLDGVWRLPDNTALDQSGGWSTVIRNYDGNCLVLWRATGDYVLCDSSCTAQFRFICEEN
ncbi:uncharacterized protein [Argopecten irradians]|uniref:uncharacterized protein n=1 Tax=Argopecten irradians TaxID=31199 RepID=UPI0037233438